jgi:GNAT superfamily N-acetyltransferase|tara:strand:+ start:196 stop:465 length:270 start_codon:yes stop_codon:yes gene_type:complete
MNNLDLSNYELVQSDGVYTFKNSNTTIGFVRFNENAEIEYIFVNPIFRKKGLAKKLLKLVGDKTGKKIILQKPISPLGAKLLESLKNNA